MTHDCDCDCDCGCDPPLGRQGVGVCVGSGGRLPHCFPLCLWTGSLLGFALHASSLWARPPLGEYESTSPPAPAYRAPVGPARRGQGAGLLQEGAAGGLERQHRRWVFWRFHYLYQSQSLWLAAARDPLASQVELAPQRSSPPLHNVCGVLTQAPPPLRAWQQPRVGRPRSSLAFSFRRWATP